MNNPRSKRRNQKTKVPYHELSSHTPKLISILTGRKILKPIDRHIYDVITDSWNTTGDYKKECFLKKSDIAIKAGRCSKTVKDSVARLQKCGIIARKYRAIDTDGKMTDFDSCPEAASFLKSLRQFGRTTMSNPVWLLTPPMKLAAPEDFGISCVNNKLRIYSETPCKKIFSGSGKIDNDRRNKVSIGVDNVFTHPLGTKLPLNDPNTNVYEDNETKLNLTKGMKPIITEIKSKSSPTEPLPSDFLLKVDSDLRDIVFAFNRVMVGNDKQSCSKDLTCLIDPNWIKQFRRNREKILAAKGSLDGWIQNEVDRLEIFRGKKGFTVRSPNLTFLANDKSVDNYLERLQDIAEQEKLGPIMSELRKENLLESLTACDSRNDPQFVIGHLILSTFFQNDCSIARYKRVADQLGFSEEQILSLGDRVFYYVGMKLLHEQGSLPRAFLIAAQKYGEQEALSVFSGAEVKSQFQFAFDVFKKGIKQSKDGTVGSNSRRKATASAVSENAGHSSASRDKLVDPENLH